MKRTWGGSVTRRLMGVVSTLVLAAALLVGLAATTGARDLPHVANVPSSLVLDALAPIDADRFFEAQHTIARRELDSVESQWERCARAHGVPASAELGWEMFPDNQWLYGMFPAVGVAQRNGSFVRVLTQSRKLTDAQELAASGCIGHLPHRFRAYDKARDLLDPDGTIDATVERLFQSGRWADSQECLTKGGVPADSADAPGNTMAYFSGQTLPPGERASEPIFTVDQLVDLWLTCTKSFYATVREQLLAHQQQVVHDHRELLADVERELNGSPR